MGKTQKKPVFSKADGALRLEPWCKIHPGAALRTFRLCSNYNLIPPASPWHHRTLVVPTIYLRYFAKQATASSDRSTITEWIESHGVFVFEELRQQVNHESPMSRAGLPCHELLELNSG